MLIELDPAAVPAATGSNENMPRITVDPSSIYVSGPQALDYLSSQPDYAPLVKAIGQSGILEEGGDFSWLMDRQLLEVLLYANFAHNGKLRKNGGQMRLIHEIGCAHRIYNNERIRQSLFEDGLPLNLPVFCMLAHDCVENIRDILDNYKMKMKKKGILLSEPDLKAPEFTGLIFDKGEPLPPFLTERLEKGLSIVSPLPLIEAIWNDSNTFPQVDLALYYMTDIPGIHDRKRVLVQKEKSFRDPKKMKEPIIPMWLQFLRIEDKVDHVVRDAIYCVMKLAEVAAYPILSSLDKLAQQQAELELRGVAYKCIRKSKMKAFVTHFPSMPKERARLYRTAQRVLECVARGEQLPPGFGEGFTSYAKIMLTSSLIHPETAHKITPPRMPRVCKVA